MKARRIMFFIHLKTNEDARKWNELTKEHPGWKTTLLGSVDPDDPGTVIIPNMTFDCADVIDEWLKEKGLERTWLKDNEPEYYVELAKIGLA